MSTEPNWLTIARSYLGEREIPGVASSSWIKSMWLSLKSGAWYWKAYGEDDSKLPWCGAFAAYVMQSAGIEPPKNYASAKAWLDWGIPLAGPRVGCIAVYGRTGGGHVNFITCRDEKWRLGGIGGNQGDAVSEAFFETSRVLGYRWPIGHTFPAFDTTLPIVALGKLSTSEA